MLLDGIVVMLTGKYIGPDKPGLWANIFYKLDINVFKLGPLFIVFGLVWLTWVYGFCTNQSWAFLFGIIISLLSVWYLPLGTLFSIIILLVLLLGKQRLGF